MRRIGFRHQRTLAKPAEIRGKGFITGASVHVRLLPAAPNTGLVFVRTDLSNQSAIPANVSQVTDTNRRTTLGKPETGVTLVEHILAALNGLRIDNCTIELNAPEPPGLDGSSYAFVQSIVEAGAVLQPERRPIWTVSEPVLLKQNGSTIGFHPADPNDGLTLRASYLLDYGVGAAIPRQAYSAIITPSTFAKDISGCRTFLLAEEALELLKTGIGKHLTAQDLLVFGPHGPHENKLRYADEPARHKVLDMLGDLALCGFDLVGHLVAYRSGHSLNVAMARALVAMVQAVPAELAAERPRFPPAAGGWLRDSD